MITNIMVQYSLSHYRTSNGPQHDISNYLGPYSKPPSFGGINVICRVRT